MRVGGGWGRRGDGERGRAVGGGYEEGVGAVDVVGFEAEVMAELELLASYHISRTDDLLHVGRTGVQSLHRGSPRTSHSSGSLGAISRESRSPSPDHGGRGR